jgi:endonuclease-8
MPEGHTLHRLAGELAELCGHPLSAISPQGRFAEGARALDGSVVTAAEAYGKHLFLLRTDAPHLHVHLGMQGKWLRSVDPSRPALPQVRLRLANEAVAWDLIAPSRCALEDDDEVHRVISSLGPDPLRADADREQALAALAAHPGPIGAALLDQSLIAGVGNVFRNEALHALGIAPQRPCSAMRPDELAGLWSVLQAMMSQAVQDGRIITVDSADRLSLPEADSRKVYKQARCRDCGAPVATSTVGGRTAYACPVEQSS